MRFRANEIGVFAALAVAVPLGGCANVDLGNKDAWFSKPVNTQKLWEAIQQAVKGSRN